MHPIEIVGLVILGVIIVGSGWTIIRGRRVRQERDEQAMAESIAAKAHIANTLHPVIDPDLCIGSLSCLAACPEGDILGVVNGKAALINASACIGHGKCALECPVGAIRLVFGSSERGIDLPEISEFFETTRNGVHIVGELGGMGLIKNAITQGLQVADYLASGLAALQAPGELVDVAIVGAGPAGLATALGLRKAGKTFRVLEQESVGGTIANYPRQKIVMSETVPMPFIGKFGKKHISKEELLATWQKALSKAKVQVEQGVRVIEIGGEDGAFALETSKGVVAARKVVLAVGRRGTPRKLGVPGEELSKVAYRLIDPQQYEGTKVLVVGGGDAGMEAAMQIAESTDAEVTLAVQSPDFTAGREANKRRVKELAAKGVLKTLMGTKTVAITPDMVRLDQQGSPVEIANDFVIVCAGGVLPTEFLTRSGIRMRRYEGQALGEVRPDEMPTQMMNAVPIPAPKVSRGSAKASAEKSKRRRLALVLFALGALTIAGLWVLGADYYLLPKAQRLNHPANAMLKSSGPWGHGVGIVATLFMMSNFLYSVRKRWRRMKGAGPINNWLTFHQFVGFMSPLVIAFHAAFQSNNVLATATAASLAIVVATGIVGRFIFGLVPTADGRTLEYGTVMQRWEQLKIRIESQAKGAQDIKTLSGLLAHATAQASPQPLWKLLVTTPFDDLRVRRSVARIRTSFPSRAAYVDFKETFMRLHRLRIQVTFYRSLKKFMSVWRVLHVVLAVALVFIICAHIGVSLFLGYQWVFSQSAA